MFSLRVLILLALIGALGGFALQNLTPSIALVFLGFRFQPLPLAFLILGAIAAGFLTGLLVFALLRFSNFLAYQRFRSRRFEPKGSSSPSSWRQAPPASDTSIEDAFDFEESPPTPAPGKTYEAEPQNRSGSQSGSTYSYRFRDQQEPPQPPPPEPTVDAEYRVVNPGSSPPPEPDYGFEDDQDWIEDDNPNSDGFGR